MVRKTLFLKRDKIDQIFLCSASFGTTTCNPRAFYKITRSGNNLNFLSPFYKGSLNCLEGKSSGKHFSLPFLPAAPSSPSQNLERIFELTQCPSRARDLPRVLLLEIQRNYESFRCVMLGAEVPGHRQKTANANLNCAIVENAHTCLHLIVQSQPNIIESVSRAGNYLLVLVVS